MTPSQDKLQKLAYVAQQYYLEDRKQGDIAAELGVSRPLVSRMLREARELGVVRITVARPETRVESVQDRLRQASSILDCVLVPDGARNYQSNENVRLIAQQLGAVPHFIYLPALPESVEEKQLLCSTEIYRKIQAQWTAMDTALVNIGNYPSSPDFASLVRYGDLLQKERTCGRLLVS